jgi:hypothetical protein
LFKRAHNNTINILKHPPPKKNIFLFIAPWCPKEHCCFEGSHSSPFVLLTHAQAACRWRWVCSIDGMILTGESEVLGEKHRPSATLSATNPTWPHLGSNPGPQWWESGN